jgi:hypothetical protein
MPLVTDLTPEEIRDLRCEMRGESLDPGPEITSVADLFEDDPEPPVKILRRKFTAPVRSLCIHPDSPDPKSWVTDRDSALDLDRYEKAKKQKQPPVGVRDYVPFVPDYFQPQILRMESGDPILRLPPHSISPERFVRLYDPAAPHADSPIPPQE